MSKPQRYDAMEARITALLARHLAANTDVRVVAHDLYELREELWRERGGRTRREVYTQAWRTVMLRAMVGLGIPGKVRSAMADRVYGISRVRDAERRNGEKA